MDPPPLSSAPPIAASSPPALPQITTSAAGAAINSYPNSLDSSPRSRNTDSWDEPPYGPSATAAPPQNPAAGGKLRLMCSYGGHIVPRPHDKSLCYIGGETRIIVSDRGTTLSDLVNRLSKTLLDGKPFALKYQLPNEDLDSLITVTTDEDFENMVDEYDRLLKTPSSRTSRLRLFLFPAKSGSETSSSIESLLENSSKSNEWFFNALNSTSPAKSHRAISETSSVNCLLGLDDQSPPVPKGASETQSEKANVNVPHQDVHSVPDSPMLETTSSFGSTSSSPSTANKVGSEEGKGGIEEVQALQQQVQVLPQPAAQLQQTKPVVVAAFDLASPDSVSSDGSGRNPLSRQKQVVYVEPVVPLQSVNAQLAASHIDPKTAELNTRAQMAQQVQENAYVMPSQFDQYQQVQYVPTGSQLMQHHHPSGAVPMYYSVYPSQQLGHHAPTMEQQHQNQHQHQHQHQYPPVYLMPTRQQAYNYPVPTYSDSVPSTPSTRVQTPPSATLVPPTAFAPASNAAAAIAKPQHLVQMPSNQPSPQYAGFSQFPHPSQTIAPSSATASYAYEYPEPTHAQIYYTQPLAPQLTTQYQTMAPNAQLKLPEISAPHPTETAKLQVRTTQP